MMDRDDVFVHVMAAAAVHRAIVTGRGSDWVAAMVEEAWRKPASVHQSLTDEVCDRLAREERPRRTHV